MTAEQERAAIIAELNRRIAEAWEAETKAAKENAKGSYSYFFGARQALESVRDYIAAGKHNTGETG